MTYYKIYTASSISEQHIHAIIKHWEVSDWNDLTAKEFRKKFANSEFHILTNENRDLLSIARINADFIIQIREQVYEFSEFVGFVSAEKGKGYGTKLLTYLVKNLQERKIETIGFCSKKLRPFYIKAHIEVLYDITKYLREKAGNEWIVPDDDDILYINLTEDSKKLFRSISFENLGYLIFSPNL